MRGEFVTTFDPQPKRLRFSVDDYYKMIDLGILDSREKAEIIDGELIKKMTIGDKHALTVDLLTTFFIKNLPDNVRVRGQNPLRLGDYDEPEPDIVLADLTKYDGKRHPRPAETILVVEVSDSTLKFDRETKIPLYAEAGIPEVWIVNLQNKIIEVYQQPSVGIYQFTKIFQLGEAVASSVLPNLALEVDSVLS
ncbi:MAG: Uma2 family endonuclease [Saprospiraceae bacterium]|nr:Uma2 family endonuclease [Pyrinomonadaceae bacterium]